MCVSGTRARARAGPRRRAPRRARRSRRGAGPISRARRLEASRSTSKNFVGLSVGGGDLIACGSETNEVFVSTSSPSTGRRRRTASTTRASAAPPLAERGRRTAAATHRRTRRRRRRSATTFTRATMPLALHQCDVLARRGRHAARREQQTLRRSRPRELVGVTTFQTPNARRSRARSSASRSSVILFHQELRPTKKEHSRPVPPGSSRGASKLLALVVGGTRRRSRTMVESSIHRAADSSGVFRRRRH